MLNERLIDSSEKILIQKAQKGDRNAFRQLVYKYQNRVILVATRILGNEDDAFDVTQEVFIRLYKYLPSYQNKNKFFTWLYRITVNTCYDFLKKERRFKKVPLEELSQTQILEKANYIQITKCQEDIMQLVEMLSTPQKTAFILREIEELSYKEIAKIMESKEVTIRSYLFYARKRLKELIQLHFPEYLEGY